MSFWHALGQTLRGAAEGFIRTGKQIMGASAQVIRKVVETARDSLDEVVRRIQRARGDANSEKEVVERQLQEVNARIARLRKNHQQNGALTGREQEEWKRLKARRDQLIDDLQNLDTAEFAQDVVDEASEYKTREVTEADAHLIDMVTGQSTYGKRCRACSRAMVLQWERRAAAPSLRDFFWGCSGWYVKLANGRSACTHTERLADADFRIFANVKRPEFQVTATELSRRVLDPGRQKRLREALDGIREQNRTSSVGISQYRCPVHGESLRLRRKNATADELLDEYFLGCPQWLPERLGCNFLIKLKSPGRISAVISEGYGQDAMKVLDA
ncbi:MAG: hypothetical protein J0H15_10205 [Xanthomonadales bacterium]|nr:hypothetical protein [Xanthomonadales bacterium]